LHTSPAFKSGILQLCSHWYVWNCSRRSLPGTVQLSEASIVFTISFSNERDKNHTLSPEILQLSTETSFLCRVYPAFTGSADISFVSNITAFKNTTANLRFRKEHQDSQQLSAVVSKQERLSLVSLSSDFKANTKAFTNSQ